MKKPYPPRQLRFILTNKVCYELVLQLYIDLKQHLNENCWIRVGLTSSYYGLGQIVHCASLFVHDNPLISSLSPCCQNFYCDKRRDVRDKITATWSVAWHARQPLPLLRELTRQQFIASPRTTRFMAYWVADLCEVRTDFIVENHCCGSDVADCMQWAVLYGVQLLWSAGLCYWVWMG